MFDNHPVNLRKQHFQVRNFMPQKSDIDDQGRQLPMTQNVQVQNITPSKPNTDHQGSQASPTYALTLSDCCPVNLRKHQFQVQNIIPLKTNTCDQGSKLPPNHDPNLVDYYCRILQSWLVNSLHLEQTTTLLQLFSLFWKLEKQSELSISEKK